MKKHFLLLLMAFMSLTGYAATDISGAVFSVADVTYGTAVLNPTTQFLVTYDITLVKDTHYEWDEKYYSDEACTTEVTLATAPVNTYYVKITGKGAFEGSKVTSFKVKKTPLHITINGGTALYTTYGTPYTVTTTIPWALTVTNPLDAGYEVKNGEDPEEIVTGSITAVICDKTAVTKEADGSALATPKDAYDVTFEGLTSTNYDIICEGALDIWKKDISTGSGMTFTLNTTSALYNGAKQELDYTVKLGETTLVAGTDYEVSTFNDADRSVAEDAKNAKKYYTKITGKGNFSGERFVAGNANFEYTIEKAGLTVRALNQTKVYDRNNTLPSSAIGVAYEVLGVCGTDDVDGDGSNTTFTHVTLTGNSSKDVKEGGYTITPNIATAYQNANYDYNFVPATFTITKRELKITANEAKKVYGKAEATVTKMDGSAADAIGYGGVTFTPTLVKDAATGLDIDFSLADEEAEMKAVSTTTPTVAVHGDLKVVRTGAGTDENKQKWEDALTVTYNSAANVWKNYTVTLEAGDFYITGGKIYVTALNQSKNYGEADPSWTAQKDVNFIVSGLSPNEELVTLPTLKRAAGENVKDYTITPSGAVAPDGYEAIVYATGTFTIKKRPLTIVPDVQTLNVGNTAADLNQKAYTITNTKADEGLVAGDKASEVFSLKINDAIAQPLGAATTYNNGIVIFKGVKAANYQIAELTGKLIVVDPDATIVLNRPAKAAYEANPALDDAADVIAAATTAKLTKAQANAYAKANITGGVVAGDLTATKYTNDEVRSWNDALPGAVADGDVILYTVETAEAANAGMVGELERLPEDFEAVVGRAPELNVDYTLEDASDASSTKLTTDAGAAAYNTAKGLPVNAGDPTGDSYDVTTAAAYNDALPGAISTDDFVPYTDETAYAKNLTLEGHKTTDDARPSCVTFGDFAMVAEKWYPIVLPFATTVKEVSETFGYAVVNILKKDNADKTKIAFKLHMGEIPANEPFVVKVYEAINMNEVTFGDLMNPYKNGKTIVNSAAPEVADASGVKFIGSYSAKTDGFKANEAFFSVSASKNDYYWGSATNTTYMAPLAAYFQIPEGAAARVIEFEEADGTTTAINFATFSNDIEKMNAEGWYTIGGQKLNGAPTQKGIFINNGKKVIIK